MRPKAVTPSTSLSGKPWRKETGGEGREKGEVGCMERSTEGRRNDRVYIKVREADDSLK